MAFLKTQSKFPTLGFKAALAFLIGFAIAGGLVWWQLMPLIGSTNNADVNLKGKGPAAAVDKNAGYLVIKEFGVRIKLAAPLTDLTYQIQTLSDGPVAYFSTTTLAGLDAQCAADKVSIGALSQFKPGATVDPPGKPVQQISTAVHVGNYYYLFNQPQAFCSDVASTQQKQTAATAALKAAVANLQASQ